MTADQTTAMRVDAAAHAAAAWRDPEHAPRQTAVAQTLGAPNRFTEEAVAYALNQLMGQLTPDRLLSWIAGRHASSSHVVAVLHEGDTPCKGISDAIAVLLTGHRYAGALAPSSPYLVPAFLEDAGLPGAADAVTFGTAAQVLERAGAVVATPDDGDRAALAEQCVGSSIGAEQRLFRRPRRAVAVLDGRERDDEWEGVAEDALLYDGFGTGSVAVIWAPRALSPDALLEAFAHFRAVFPPHADTPGALSMQRAFLKASGQPHAYGDGLEFLMSRGEADLMPPGHIRWVEYDDLREVEAWTRRQQDRLSLVTARRGLATGLSVPQDVVGHGEAHRRHPGWHAPGEDVVGFLSRL